MKIITKTAELQDFCDRLAEELFVTLDTEFHREKTYFPLLCLVQLGGKDDAAAIDPLAENLDLTPLRNLLFNEKVLKVLHSGSQDLEIFVQLFDDVPRPLFDTQVAAMFCGHGESIGYNNLVKKICGVELDKSQQFTDWTRRPLSEKQLLYALGDVTYLRDVYLKIHADLKKRGRLKWVEEETASMLLNADQYRPNPENAWRRIRKVRSTKPRYLALLQELAAWREHTAVAEDIPRQRVLKDEGLMEVAHAVPKSRNDLKDLRGLHGGIIKHYGDAILAAVTRAEEIPLDDCPRMEFHRPLKESQAALVDMLKLLLKVRCREEGLVPRLIAGNEDLEELARKTHPDIRALHGWRNEVFGTYALALKEGRLTVGYRNGEIMLKEST